jgi:hypothetical protein
VLACRARTLLMRLGPRGRRGVCRAEAIGNRQ